MLRRSYIFTFNLMLICAAAVLLLAPVWIAEKYLVPLYSSQRLQMSLMDLSIEHGKHKMHLLLGDSTIRNLHATQDRIEADLFLVNLGAGGAMAEEWYYAMRNALRVGKRFKSVVVGMSKGESLESNDLIPPYFPFLLDTADVLGEYRAHHFSLSQMFQLLSYIHLKFLYTRSDILYAVVTAGLPEMRTFMMNSIVQQMEKDGAAAGGISRRTPVRKLRGVEMILTLAKKEGLPIRFVLSPTSKESREDKQYIEGRNFFSQSCKKLRMQCSDLSAVLPDEFFAADGVHLKGEHLGLYKGMLEKILAKDARP